jgi:hypothetical protein
MSLSKVHSKYGAPMGRGGETLDGFCSAYAGFAESSDRVQLARVYLNSGGYDSGGAYWGHGAPLYRALFEAHGDYWECWLRANSRDEAKRHIQEGTSALGLKARFYR